MLSKPQSWLPGRHVPVFPEREVTRAGVEDAPASAGLSRDDVEAMWRAVTRLYRTGLHPALALTVLRRGRTVLSRSIGHVGGGVVAAPDTLFNLFSASKCVTAMLIHQLVERGALRLDDTVASFLPDFGRHGKEWVTVRHLLTHRGGISVLRAPVDLDLLAQPARIVELICDAPPAGPAGLRPAYQALAGGYLLGAIVEKVTGQGIDAHLRREDRRLGLGLSYGLPAARLPEIAENVFTGAAPVPPLSWMFRRAVGVDFTQAVELSNHPAFLTSVVPSGNVIASAPATARFFQRLLDGGEGLVAPDTLAAALAPAGARLELDGSLGLPIRYSAGFMLGADRISLYGRRTARAFGHIGFSNIVAWADPDRQLAACLMASGKPFITPGQLVWLNVARTISKRCET